MSWWKKSPKKQYISIKMAILGNNCLYSRIFFVTSYCFLLCNFCGLRTRITKKEHIILVQKQLISFSMTIILTDVTKNVLNLVSQKKVIIGIYLWSSSWRKLGKPHDTTHISTGRLSTVGVGPYSYLATARSLAVLGFRH